MCNKDNENKTCDKKIILASSSPRRSELLQKYGVSFTKKAATSPEKFQNNLSIEEANMMVAYHKALEVYNTLDKTKAEQKDVVVIGADTIVVINNEILGKPKNRLDAFMMLKKLSNQTHYVMTSVAFVMENKYKTFFEKTYVTFKAMSDDEIYAYIDSENVYDKAGSYAIQGGASKYITMIKGDYDNVVGLPVKSLLEELHKFIS